MSNEEYKQILLDYLLVKIKREDWHAVWDVAIDLQRLADRMNDEQPKMC